MGQTADHAAGQGGPAQRLGFQPDQVVQELGWDEDCDDDLRVSIEEHTGHELVDEDYEDVVDAAILWWRDGDGDLVDALVDALTDLTGGGVIWLLTPKVGRVGYVDASEIADAAPTAGLTTTTSVTVSDDWAGTRLVAPKSARTGRR